MKKRVPAKPKPRADRPSPKGGAALPRVQRRGKREAMDEPGGLSGPIVVSDAQFQALLDLIENPPEVSEELRREVAAARLWK